MFLSFQSKWLVDNLIIKTLVFHDRVVEVDSFDILTSVMSIRQSTDIDSLQHIHHWALNGPVYIHFRQKLSSGYENWVPNIIVAIATIIGTL